MSPATNVRPARPQTVMRVIRTERISEHLVRVIAGGEDFATNDFTDKYVKLHFVKPQLGLEPPYDLQALRDSLPPEDRPVTRTYTVRQVGDDWISIDFVIHGDIGIAGPWAQAAQPGDPLVFSGPGGGYSPDVAADWHLLAGDLSALPAIASALESLPDSAVGNAIIEVDSLADQISLYSPVGVDIRWILRTEQPSAGLAQALRALEWRDGRVHAFIHGEREAIKSTRQVLFVERGLSREQVSISGYWAYGRSEDAFQAEKREPIGAV